MLLSSLPKRSVHKCPWTTPVTCLVNETNSNRHLTIRMRRHFVQRIILNTTFSKIFLWYNVASIHFITLNFYSPLQRVISTTLSQTEVITDHDGVITDTVNTINRLETPWTRNTTPPYAAPLCVTVAGKAHWLWVKHVLGGNLCNYVAWYRQSGLLFCLHSFTSIPLTIALQNNERRHYYKPNK
jgi:hypothetical protein